MGETVALVVAAGRGTRFAGDRPKQYAPLRGRPILRYSLEAFRRHPRIAAVQVVIHGDDRYT
ncbi:MAG: bifunctional 2-C-methyl-D-erythritol 4-phosphate cytidylyltransferase/2-C-methyl-D-erythritol 2,4-cyclodiphosphate synthase, partial [Alphaproteobacteria bacterium]